MYVIRTQIYTFLRLSPTNHYNGLLHLIRRNVIDRTKPFRLSRICNGDNF